MVPKRDDFRVWNKPSDLISGSYRVQNLKEGPEILVTSVKGQGKTPTVYRGVLRRPSYSESYESY